jgi:AcrR family transcriptional regulator
MAPSSHPTRLNPRKRPVQLRSTETVRIILEAAARILEERGFAGYTTNAVAELAGVSVGTLYQYFPGKEALTVALIEREAVLFLGDVEATEQLTDGREALLQLITAAVRQQMRRPVLARLLDFEERRLPFDQHCGHVSVAFIKAISGQLGRMPSLDLPDIEEAASDILAIVKGVVDRAGERGETDQVRLGERVTRAVLGFLGCSEVLLHLSSKPTKTSKF